jgi:hypothetical protein
LGEPAANREFLVHQTMMYCVSSLNIKAQKKLQLFHKVQKNDGPRRYDSAAAILLP